MSSQLFLRFALLGIDFLAALTSVLEVAQMLDRSPLQPADCELRAVIRAISRSEAPLRSAGV